MNLSVIFGIARAMIGSGGVKNLRGIFETAEAEVAQLGELVIAGEHSVERLDTAPPGSGVNVIISSLTWAQKREMIPVFFRVLDAVATGGKYMMDEVTPTRQAADEQMLEEVKHIAREYGAVEVGFTRINEHDIFKGYAIPYQNAIVFTSPMDQEAINTAPGFPALREVITTYADLGKLAIKLTDYLRAKGYGAYPGFPIGGLVDYVRVAQDAGIGAIGYHGMLISGNEGTRQRINLVFTNMEIPQAQENEHEWILDFCAMCQKCVRDCPADAIYTDAPVHPETGRKSTIHYKNCVDYYGANKGCAVCVKVCPFSQAGYDKIQEGFLTAQAKRLAREELH